MVEKQESRVQQLIQEVISAMQAKKGQRVVLLDLRGIEKAVTTLSSVARTRPRTSGP